MKIIILILLLACANFAQTMRFTGNEISIGDGKSFSGVFIEGIAGDTLIFGQSVFLYPGDNKVYIADEAIDSTILSVNYVSVEDSVLPNKKGRFLYSGFYRDTSQTLTEGNKVCVDEVAFSNQFGNCTYTLGYVVDTITVALYGGDARVANISGGDTSHYSLFDWVLGLQDTVDEIQSLIGTGGFDTTYVYEVTDSLAEDIDDKVSISGDTMTGALILPDGSEPAPSLQLGSSANNGFHLQAAGVIDANALSQFRIHINNGAAIYDFQTTQFLPAPDNSVGLGSLPIAWADFFLGFGATINFDSSDAVITHSLNTLALSGANLAVLDTAYGAGWNGSANVPTKNAVYDMAEAKLNSATFDDSVAHYISDAAYAIGWDGVTTIAPSKNAVYDKVEGLSSIYEPKSVEVTVNAAGNYDVFQYNNTNVFVDYTGDENPMVLFNIGTPGIGRAYVYVRNAPTGFTVTLDFTDKLNGTDANIVLTDADNGSTFIFMFHVNPNDAGDSWWYQIL